MQSSFGAPTRGQPDATDQNSYETIEQLRNVASQKLIESGERDRLMKHLRQRLIESGWRDEVTRECKRFIRQRGVDNITVDAVVEEVRPMARRRVPDSIKQELVSQIKEFLVKVMMADNSPFD